MRCSLRLQFIDLPQPVLGAERVFRELASRLFVHDRGGLLRRRFDIVSLHGALPGSIANEASGTAE